jgi:hypothetical protein
MIHPTRNSRPQGSRHDVKMGDVVYDADYGLTGLVVEGPCTFTDTDDQTHEWEFLIMFDDGYVAGSDGPSLTVITTMKTGDMVVRKGRDWTALVIQTYCECSPYIPTHEGDPKVRYVDILWTADGSIDSCSASLLEVIDGNR